MKKLEKQFTQLEAIIEHSSLTEQHQIIKELNDFTDRLSLQDVGKQPANHKMVKVGIDREDVDRCLERIISDREWREVINEIWNSYKIYEICKQVILVYVEMLLKQEFCDNRFSKNLN